MTISEARSALFDWFEKNESFSLERDYSKLILITDCEDQEKKAGVDCALRDFVDAEFLKVSEYEGISYFFLVKPFSSYEQDITLNAETCAAVSRSINDFCEVLDDNRDWCDPRNVREKDVFNLTNIITILCNKKDP